MSSQILIPESLFGLTLEREGRGHIFFHNSLLHSNINALLPPPGWEAEACVLN